MDPEGGLPSWWNSKLTIASNSMNKLRDYLLVPSMTKEAAHDDSKTKETDKSQDTIRKLENQIQMLKVELENEKNKTVKPEPNPDTGEIPLRTGLANALLDKNAKNKPEPTKMDKKKIKISGKSKVEMNPDVEIGVFSGGKQTPSGNLH